MEQRLAGPSAVPCRAGLAPGHALRGTLFHFFFSSHIDYLSWLLAANLRISNDKRATSMRSFLETYSS